jgi:hypothetical protein
MAGVGPTKFSSFKTHALDLEPFDSSTSSALVAHALYLGCQLVQGRIISYAALIDPLI